jgi:hypothetical protein
VAQPDLFNEPTPSDAVARCIEHRIYVAGQVYWTTLYLPSVVETRELFDELEAHCEAVGRKIRSLSHAQNAFNAAQGRQDSDTWAVSESQLEFLPNAVADFVRCNPWQRFDYTIEDALERLAFLKRPGVNLAELLEQPPTRRKDPERVLWEAVFALLQECGVDPMEKYQPVIHTLRAVHRLFGIKEPPSSGHVGYVKSEFLKSAATTK